jgi:hypothetical protein
MRNTTNQSIITQKDEQLLIGFRMLLNRGQSHQIYQV